MLPKISSFMLGPKRDTLGDLRNMTLEISVVDGEGRIVPFALAADNGTNDVLIRRE